MLIMLAVGGLAELLLPTAAHILTYSVLENRTSKGAVVEELCYDSTVTRTVLRILLIPFIASQLLCGCGRLRGLYPLDGVHKVGWQQDTVLHKTKVKQSCLYLAGVMADPAS